MRIERALVSVSDKTGVVDFAKGLAEAGVELLSTGGTARALREAGLQVVDVSEYTESPEIMDGRVKTLHPRVHGGILMRDRDDDREALGSIGGKPIGLVVCNLYPFEKTVASGAEHDEVIENIDIGGPSMVRSAAKNHARVTIVSDPADYGRVLEAIREGGETSLELRRELAAKAFSHTAAYDGAIAAYMTREEGSAYPRTLTLSLRKAYDVRYGENPHQTGAFYVDRDAPAGSLALAESLDAGKKELSFNNLVDVDAALDAVREFPETPAAVVVKHTNPCGVGRAATLEEAYRIARQADSQSAFGGIVALNRPVDLATAEAVAETFIECVIAPSYAEDALARLQKKGNLRILATNEWLDAEHEGLHYKRISGGVVVQDRDATGGAEVQTKADGEVSRVAKVVTERQPTEDEWDALEFAWRVCKHVKSNAIIFAKPDRTVGVGAGQMARVTAVKIASEKSGELSQGAVMASDAFFPFPDGIEAAAAAGITAVVHPGGSKNDAAVIEAANKAGLAMVFTGVRHFRH